MAAVPKILFVAVIVGSSAVVVGIYALLGLTRAFMHGWRYGIDEEIE